MGSHCLSIYLALLNNVSKNLRQTTNADGIFGLFICWRLMVKVYLCCFTQFTVDQSKLTVNGSVLSDPPNVRYLAALLTRVIVCEYVYLPVDLAV